MSLRTQCRAFTKANLVKTWLHSKDSTLNAGKPGIDGITAQQFAARLDSNIANLAKAIRNGQYGPSPLRAVLIPKPNSKNDRLICIPTIQDRIVQRALMGYLASGSRLRISRASSYGFLPGRGVRNAISDALELRTNLRWCVKTDIESFFDSIPRDQLKDRIERALPRNSVTPLLKRFVDCEVKEDRRLRAELAARGIKRGVGLRQGMPLSPLLSNFVLAPFDFHVERRRLKMVRYADDIILFFESKAEAQAGLQFVRDDLLALGFTIPDLDDHSKTKLVAPTESVEFLGRELRVAPGGFGYVSAVSHKQIAKIKQRLESEFNFSTQSDRGMTFQDSVVTLTRSICSYLGIYKDAYNFTLLDSALRGSMRDILESIFQDIFGESVLENVNDRARTYLGFGKLELPDPVNDIEDLA
ncbi:reverse transcriptase domain-containing protein [Rhodopseudomonas sp. G2_2311]|uniref:reverse transcriptase domain-containing protein n=1 Tax=Rhodopseudomonas sp. G2_2311 TaxID=3114287 RepID=UPI0039C6DB9E